MSKKNVEELLIAGGENEAMRLKYDALKTMEDFVAAAAEDGYEFSLDDLEEVLRESGDSFDSFGNPPKRTIWWQ
jgi:predicted ribosomally synthesized peptide with nif11-like leader